MLIDNGQMIFKLNNSKCKYKMLKIERELPLVMLNCFVEFELKYAKLI